MPFVRGGKAMGELDGKVAIVTGAGQGIGEAIALKLAQAGADVVVCDINEETAKGVAEKIRSFGRRSMIALVDVADAQQVNNMVEQVLEEFGRIDILVNNAGITRDTIIVRMKDEDWQKVLDINLKGAFNCIRAVARTMMRQRSGKIVNIASIIGQIGNVGQANYAASKAGLIGLTKSAARELASRGINVNAVAPGYITTSMTQRLPEDIRQRMLEDIPLGRFGEVDDVADVVLFLVSDAARYITGQVIRVDGGMVM